MIRILAAGVVAASLIAAPAFAQDNATGMTTTKKVETKSSSKSASGAKHTSHKKTEKSTDGTSKTEMSSSTTPAKK